MSSRPIPKSDWVPSSHQTTTAWCNECQLRTFQRAFFPPEGGNGEWRCQDTEHDRKVKRNKEIEERNKGKFGTCSCCGPSIRAFSLELERLARERAEAEKKE